MKKILLLFCTLLCAFNLSAQNYENYLQKAYSALEEGKIEVAQSSYNIYKKMTGKSDLDFETLIKDADVNDWKKLCYIIDCGNGKYLAVQKTDSLQTKLTYESAKNRCQSSRVGGFNDWRLPTPYELRIIISTIDLPIQGFYWTLALYDYPNKKVFDGGATYTSRWMVIHNSGEEYDIIFKVVKYADSITSSEVYINDRRIGTRQESAPKYNYITIREFAD